MIATLKKWFSPEIQAVVTKNNIVVRRTGAAESSSVSAPFSCSHMVVSDVDIFEHALVAALRRLDVSGWAFSTITVSTPNHTLHHLERVFIAQYVENAGASKVQFAEGEGICEEGRDARDSYVSAQQNCSNV